MKTTTKKKIVNITPNDFKCGIGIGCPAIYRIEGEGKFAIIGKKVDPDDLGLSENIGKDELLIVVDENMLKNIK